MSIKAIRQPIAEILQRFCHSKKNFPIIVSLTMKNQTIVKEFERAVGSIIADCIVQTQALLRALSGEFTPSGLLPFQIPADMETVEQ